MQINDAEFRHFLSRAREAQKGGKAAWSGQTIGEKAAVAIALNRADWLAEMNYTIADAIDRTNPVWLSLLPRIVRTLDNDA